MTATGTDPNAIWQAEWQAAARKLMTGPHLSERDFVTKVADLVTEVEAGVGTLRGKMAADVIDQVVGERIEKFTAKFSESGITTIPAGLLAEHEDKLRAEYDQGLRSEAAGLEARLAEHVQGVTHAVRELGQLPDPLPPEDYTQAGSEASETRRLRLVAEVDRVERRLAGATPSQVLALYEAAADTTLLRQVIEREQAAGWPVVRLAPGDAEGVRKLSAAITTAQRARVAAKHPRLVESEARLLKLDKSATLKMLFQHLKRGRGIARLPRRQTVTLGGAR